MIQINWAIKNSRKRNLYFDDLAVNEGFRNASNLGQGAVYIKVVDNSDNYWMQEVATGKLWKPTQSIVERVPIEMNIGMEKPNIYV